MKVLFINACVRENSRTKIIANDFLKKFNTVIEEIDLVKLNLKPLDTQRLQRRDYLIANKLYNDEMFDLAHQFSEADEIVIAAPYWDLSFPALLKLYFENITVGGITFYYDNGVPKGLCKARKVTYITTSGGKIFVDYGYSYVKTLVSNLYGIKDTVCYKVENLDVNCIEGNDVLNQEIIEVK